MLSTSDYVIKWHPGSANKAQIQTRSFLGVGHIVQEETVSWTLNGTVGSSFNFNGIQKQMSPISSPEHGPEEMRASSCWCCYFVDKVLQKANRIMEGLREPQLHKKQARFTSLTQTPTI